MSWVPLINCSFEELLSGLGLAVLLKKETPHLDLPRPALLSLYAA